MALPVVDDAHRDHQPDAEERQRPHAIADFPSADAQAEGNREGEAERQNGEKHEAAVTPAAPENLRDRTPSGPPLARRRQCQRPEKSRRQAERGQQDRKQGDKTHPDRRGRRRRTADRRRMR